MIGIWISAVCSVLTLITVIYFVKPGSVIQELPVVPVANVPLPSSVKIPGILIPTYIPQLGSGEVKDWISRIEKVMASGKTMKIQQADGPVPLRKFFGRNMPVENIEWMEIRPDGSFSVRFTKEHFFEYPLATSSEKNQYARIQVKEGVLTGKLIKGKTENKGIPVKILVFEKPHKLSLDPLDKDHHSTVPDIAKMFGALPNIVALVCHKSLTGWYMAPQLDGHGAGENPGLMKDLLKIDDVMDPGMLSKL